jgi:PAS domain S-box-containing protein
MKIADMTKEELIKALAESRRNEAQFRAVAENTADSIMVADETGTIIYWNRGSQKIFGYEPGEIIGKTIDLLLRDEEAASKYNAFETYEDIQDSPIFGKVQNSYAKRKNGVIFPVEITLSGWVLDNKGYFCAIIRDTTERLKAEIEKERLINDLKNSLAQIKTLRGLLPICANCKKIRDDAGYWNKLESYIKNHSEANFTHSICPECAKELYPDFYDEP